MADRLLLARHSHLMYYLIVICMCVGLFFFSFGDLESILNIVTTSSSAFSFCHIFLSRISAFDLSLPPRLALPHPQRYKALRSFAVSWTSLQVL